MSQLKISHLAVALLLPSPTNPRKFFDEKEIADLAASVKDKGVLEPLLVRAHKTSEGKFEIIVGERRYRASKKAGLADVPCIIRELDDQQVVEIQIVENMQRQDLQPLEEAQGYQLLHEKHNYSYDDLALKIGKSKAYVYGRLNLLKLSSKVQKALGKGEIKLAFALELIRVADHKAQDELLGDMLPDWGGSPDINTVAELKRQIENRYLLELKHAPFNTKDAELCPKAGACSVCPKRTGNQTGLFEDDKKDICLDFKCYQLKVDTQAQKLVKRFKAEGKTVIEGVEAENFEASQRGMIDLDEKNHDLKGAPTTREALRRHGADDKVHPVIVIDSEGHVKMYVKEADVKAVLPKKALDEDSYDRGSYGVKKPSKEARRKRLLELKATRAAWGPAWKLAIGKIVTKELKGETLMLLVKQLAKTDYGSNRDAAKRMGKDFDSNLRSAKNDMAKREALWNLVMGIGLYDGQTGPTERAEAIFKATGVSWAVAKQKAAAAITAAKKAKLAGKGKPAASPKKKNKK